jgi:two-component system, OmpR family, response regulator
VVDDDFEIRSVICELLKSEGFNVQSAKNGEEALKCISEDLEFGLIILDLLMPQMSGQEFLRLKNQAHLLKEIPVLVFSASKFNQEVLEGVTSFIAKPVDLDHLLTEVRKHCRPAFE